ncbi:MAG TPA: cytochrome C oxidase subunit IV family protein [Candidatus Polarisedimenticolia bacterium]|nr:cytochrome C oxidase subunit IV family protein [Candidatus Polarisedimenticolia bacterium]
MENHVARPRTYVAIFGTLMLLTAATIGIAYLDLGPLNAVAAMTIACAKALLVVLYFMHLRYGNKLIWVMMACGVLWLVILIGLTMADYAGRGWLPFPGK